MSSKKPNRATRSFTQHLAAEPARVFPLLCPVRETEWIDGWKPLSVISESGFAEPDCVFTTAAEPGNAIWYITRHEPDAGVVELLRITPQVTACRITIQLKPEAKGTKAKVTYSHTSLGTKGDALVAGFTDEYYERYMRDWEKRLNHYLTTGKILRSIS